MRFFGISDSGSLGSMVHQRSQLNPLRVTLHRCLLSYDLSYDLRALGSLIPVWKSQKIRGNTNKTHTTKSTKSTLLSILPTVRVGKQNSSHCYVAKNLHINPSWIKTRKTKRAISFTHKILHTASRRQTGQHCRDRSSRVDLQLKRASSRAHQDNQSSDTLDSWAGTLSISSLEEKQKTERERMVRNSRNSENCSVSNLSTEN